MLDAYLEPILTAFFCFPFLALLMTIPYMIYEYRKYGSILVLRTILVYSFVLYLITSYFLVILPLPPRSLVAHYTSPTMQLQLGHFWQDILLASKGFSNFSSLFQSPAIYTVLFNLFLTFPFGVYLRYYYEKKWYQVLLFTFLLSLFFEWTQLSGLYGIYPRSYRLFDVDDLLINTLGGLFGFLSTPLFTKFLPKRSALDEKAFAKGKRVSAIRRFLAFVIDLFFLAVVMLILVLLGQETLLSSHLFLVYLVAVFFYFLLFPLVLDQRTLGKMIVRIKWVTEQDEVPKKRQILLSNLLLYYVLLPTPYYLFLLSKVPIPFWMQAVLGSVLGVNYCLFGLEAFLLLVGVIKRFGYERVSKTKNKSTI